jgi:hypothetical protein
MGPGPPHVALFTGSLAHYPVYQKSEKEKTVKKDKKKRKTKTFIIGLSVFRVKPAKNFC